MPYLYVHQMAVPRLALVYLEAGDLSFNYKAETSAVAHHTRHQRLTVFCVRHLVLVYLPPLQSHHGHQTNLTVPPGDHGHQLLCGHQLYVLNFLHVTHTDDFCKNVIQI